MRVLSATEAISPAIDRTKALLQPFALGRWLKLGLVALLAEMSGQFAFPPVAGIPQQQQHFAAPWSGTTSGPAMLVIAIIAIVAFVIALVLFYLGSRMRLVLMDLVATRTTLIAPAWHRTASRTWRWIGIQIIFIVAAFIAIGVVLAVPVLYFIRSARAGNSHVNVAVFLSNFVFLFLAMFLAVFAVAVVFLFLRDFVLPFILFGDARLGDALRNAVFIARREPGGVLFYFFMRFVLMIAAGLAGELCVALAALAFGIPTRAIGAVLWFTLHQSSRLALIAMFGGFVLLGAIFFVGLVCTVLCVSAAVLIFYQSYALYFVGGRYPVLGNLMEPPPPPALEPQFQFNPS